MEWLRASRAPGSPAREIKGGILLIGKPGYWSALHIYNSLILRISVLMYVGCSWMLQLVPRVRRLLNLSGHPN
jgi:hypothetical protein